MNLSMEIMVVVVLLSASIVWLLHAGERLGKTWIAASSRAGDLKRSYQRDAKILLRHVGEIERLNRESGQIRGQIDDVVKETAAKRGELKAMPTPAPTNIYILTEYPTMKQHLPWVVRLRWVELSGKRIVRDVNHHELMWASDVRSAQLQAESIYGRQGFQITGVSRLSDPPTAAA